MVRQLVPSLEVESRFGQIIRYADYAGEWRQSVAKKLGAANQTVHSQEPKDGDVRQ